MTLTEAPNTTLASRPLLVPVPGLSSSDLGRHAAEYSAVEAAFELDKTCERLTVLAAEGESNLEPFEDAMAQQALQLFKEKGYTAHYGEFFRMVEYFADKPEFAEGFVDNVFDMAPELAFEMIDEFAAGNKNPGLERIVTGRAFIWWTQASAGNVRKKGLRSELSPHDYKKLEHGFTLEKAILNRSGFDEEEQRDILDAWSTEWYQKKHTSRSGEGQLKAGVEGMKHEWRNLMAVASLYREDAQMPKRLYDDYGIRHFARYYNVKTGTSALNAQLAPKFSFDGEVFVSATEDWNGALRRPTPMVTSANVNMQHPLFMEARSPTEAWQRLLQVNAHSDTGLIHKLLLSAHGSSSEVGDLTIKDLQRFRGMERLAGRVLSRDAEIILDSCDTGKRFGIGRKLAKLTGVTVAAPPKASQGMHPEENNNYRYKKRNGKYANLRYYTGRPTPRHTSKTRTNRLKTADTY